MKIAILEPYIEGIGGAQKVIGEYASFLKEKGHDVTIFTQRYSPSNSYSRFKKLKIVILRPESKIFVPFLFLFKKFIDFDLIIANDWPTNFSSIFNKNVFWVCYSPKRDFFDLKNYYLDKSPLFKKICLILKRILFKKIDILSAKKALAIASNSGNTSQRIKKYYSRDAIVSYHGINFNEYKNGDYDNYFISVSRLVSPKRVDIIIKSMAFIRDPNLKLLIIGDGPERKNLENLAKEDKRILFLGAVSEKALARLYSNCRAVIYIPKNEDWGLVPLEAAASKKATIGVKEGGLKESIIDNKTGFLIRNICPKSLAKKITLLAADKSLAKKMGENAHKYCKKFDWKILLPLFENLVLSYCNMLPRAKRA